MLSVQYLLKIYMPLIQPLIIKGLRQSVKRKESAVKIINAYVRKSKFGQFNRFRTKYTRTNL